MRNSTLGLYRWKINLLLATLKLSLDFSRNEKELAAAARTVWTGFQIENSFAAIMHYSDFHLLYITYNESRGTISGKLSGVRHL